MQPESPNVPCALAVTVPSQSVPVPTIKLSYRYQVDDVYDSYSQATMLYPVDAATDDAAASKEAKAKKCEVHFMV